MKMKPPIIPVNKLTFGLLTNFTLLSISIAFLSVLLACTNDDVVTMSNAPGTGSDKGILVDAQSTSGQENDKSFTSNTTSIVVGQLDTSPSSNEVIAFTNFRPVAIQTPVTWTSGKDVISIPFSGQITIPVRVWIVKGPFTTQRDKAIDACITTSNIWNSERMGVKFGPFEIVDATGDADASNYFAFDCSKKTGIESDIGKTSGRINIYYVNTVDGGLGRGQACDIGSDFVAMGAFTWNELLAHELGHDLALEHIDTMTSDFDQTNVMHSSSIIRQYLTEGQLFRAHLRPNSAINFVYNARPGQPTRNCGHSDANDQCTDINKRIWADGGSFPPN